MLHLLPQLQQGDNAGTLVLASEKHALAENIYGDHLLQTGGGLDALPLSGEALARGDVELMLVLETAEQAPAPT